MFQSLGLSHPRYTPKIKAFAKLFTFVIVLGFIAIRRGDMIRHRAWMTRAYAIGLGAGTQVLTGLVGELTIGTPNELENALLMGAGWMINVAVAEWSIRRKPGNRARKASPVVSHSA